MIKKGNGRCNSKDLKYYGAEKIENGVIVIWKCVKCGNITKDH